MVKGVLGVLGAGFAASALRRSTTPELTNAIVSWIANQPAVR